MTGDLFKRLWPLIAQEEDAVLKAIALCETVEEVEVVRDTELVTFGRRTVHRHCLRRIRELGGERRSS